MRKPYEVLTEAIFEVPFGGEDTIIDREFGEGTFLGEEYIMFQASDRNLWLRVVEVTEGEDGPVIGYVGDLKDDDYYPPLVDVTPGLSWIEDEETLVDIVRTYLSDIDAFLHRWG